MYAHDVFSPSVRQMILLVNIMIKEIINLNQNIGEKHHNWRKHHLPSLYNNIIIYNIHIYCNYDIILMIYNTISMGVEVYISYIDLIIGLYIFKYYLAYCTCSVL